MKGLVRRVYGVGLKISYLEEQLGLGGERQPRHGGVALDEQERGTYRSVKFSM